MSIAEDMVTVHPIIDQLEEMGYLIFSEPDVISPVVRLSEIQARNFYIICRVAPRYEDICSDISNRFDILDL